MQASMLQLVIFIAGKKERKRKETAVRISLPLPEFLKENPIGETLSANSDTFKYTIASQLVKYQVSINSTSSLLVIWDDTTDEIWACTVQCVH